MEKEFVSMKCLVRDENREAGIKRGSGELFILTHELADEMVERIVEAVMQRVANLEKGTWKTPNETPGTQTCLTVDQLAKELQISRTNAYALVKQVGFPSFSVGRKVLISRNGLQRWMDNGGTKYVKAC